jgi:pimeloyl-ACP methyl ester carboxylesterase
MMVQDKNTTIGGAHVHYLQAGEEHGRALLLLHGLGTAEMNWQGVMPMLAENFHVLAPDLPGYGDSAVLPDMRLQPLMQWLKTLLDRAGIQQAVVVGSSTIGGLIARLFAAGEPQYVPAAILVNGGSVPSLPPILRTVANMPVLGDLAFGLLAGSTTSPGAINRMVHVASVKTPELNQQVRASGNSVSGMLRLVARDPLPANRSPLVPTMLLWGADDQLATLDEAEKIKATIPGSTLSPIADCGHLPQLEASEVFVWQVQQFVENLTRPRKAESRGAGMLGQKK